MLYPRLTRYCLSQLISVSLISVSHAHLNVAHLTGFIHSINYLIALLTEAS